MTEGKFKTKAMSLKRKICITIFGLILFIILLEFVLRFMGYYYLSMRVAPYGMVQGAKKDTGKHVILCLGDSFTFGGNLPFEFSYPFQLEKMLNSTNSGKIFEVINAGYCEQNSAQILKSLPDNLKHYQADSVVLLVGASNWFNFIGLNKEEEGLYARFKNFLYDLRVFKMAKIMALNLEYKIMVMKFKQKFSPKTYGFMDGYYSFRSAVDPHTNILREMAESRLNRVKCLSTIGENGKASEMFKKIMKVDPNSDLYIYQIADYLEYIHRGTGLRAGEQNDPNLVAMFLQRKFENNSNTKDKLLTDYFLFFKTIQNAYKNEDIKMRFKEDLEEIISLCKKNNVKLIIQDYPFPYPLADTVIRDIAAKYSLPLVRNSKAFAELLAKEKKEAYFLTDTHCTPLGYQVMAQDVYNMLLSENILSQQTSHSSQE